MGSRLQKNSEAIRKRIESHTFDDETGEEYEGSKFGGFPEYFRRKKIKLQNLDAELRSSSAGTPQIFKGIVAHVNGYTQPSLNDLHRMIVSHGGGFMQYLDGKTTVTHIIAATLTPKKAVEFKRYRIVKPAWIVDSVKAGRVLPWENYRVIDEGVGQSLLGFNDGKIVNQAPTQSRSYRDQSTGSWYEGLVKDVAEDIDNEDGSKFSSSQRVVANGTGAYLALNSSKKSTLNNEQHEAEEPDPSNPESFSYSSSLEDVLAAAEIKHLHQHQQDERKVHAEIGPKTGIDVAQAIELARPEIPIYRSLDETKYTPPLDQSSPSKKGRVMTAEEHNAILLADPHIRKSSTANPDFLRQYYSESRLHHLSAWKSDLKSQLQQMATEKSPCQKQAQKRKPGSRRYIMHVDFDSFFCAVSLKSAPEYMDKPTVVAHGSGAGSEIASCNYPARVFGVKNGMWMKKALELCPEIKVLPYDFPAYEEASREFYKAILDVGGVVQSVSIDEALVDISSLCLPVGGSEGQGTNEEIMRREQERAEEIGRSLRQRIRELTGCAVSVGIGGNILLAKVALRKAKPAGQYQIRPEEILDFIGELLVQDLPGVAYSIGGKLEEIGVKFVKDIRSLSKDRLMTVLGPKTGEKIWEYSYGIDRTEVGEQVVRKSVSAEVNWGIRFINQQEAEGFVQNLCIELQKRLIDQGVKGRQLTMKIMRRAADTALDPPKHLGHGKCDTFNKSIVLGVATNSADILGREAISILRSYGFSPGELRGLGVQMTKLEQMKVNSAARPDGSQKKISFNNAAGPKLFRKETDDPIDDPDSPQKPKIGHIHPAAFISRVNATDASAKKPLNLMGTQFIIPSQIDPKVLAELPHDIRSKLLAQSKSAPTSRAQSPLVEPIPKFHGKEFQDTSIPSQLDPEVFDALPEDVKAEVRASYSSRSTVARAQGVLPQSPRKARTLTTKKSTTPTKKRTGLQFRGRNIKSDSNSTLTQSNFVIGNRGGMGESSKLKDLATTDSEDDPQSDTLDPEFLAALPEDVRIEVLAEHRRSRLARRSGLGLSTSRKPRPIPSGVPPGQQRKIQIPQRPPKPTFTTQELSTLPELRETLGAWHREFATEGPHPDDVAAMERYLRRVVLEEKDMAKAAGVVKWLAYLIDDSVITGGDTAANEATDYEEEKKGLSAWKDALESIRDTVQEAVKERGLGKLDLS